MMTTTTQKTTTMVTMTMMTKALEMLAAHPEVLPVGCRVEVDGNPAWQGTLEYLLEDGFAGVRQGRRVDEVQVWRLARM